MSPEHDQQFLMLVRHSAVNIEMHKASNEWSLSEEGRERCHQFTPLIAPYQPNLFVTSQENKAIETGMLLAKALRVPSKSATNLHEHDRQGVPVFGTHQEFRSAIGRFFASPDQLVFGRETAAQAAERFDSAIRDLVEQHQGHNLAIVAHGTVMTLFVNRYNPDLDQMIFWDSLMMPCAVLLRPGDMTLQELILPLMATEN